MDGLPHDDNHYFYQSRAAISSKGNLDIAEATSAMLASGEGRLRGTMALAAAALRELARRQPADGAAPHNLGTLLLRGGDAARAIEAFRVSLARRPRAALTHLSLGYALNGAGRRDEAAAAFHDCLRLAPDSRLCEEAQRQLQAMCLS